MEAAESSLDRENHGWTTSQRAAPQLPPERLASHPYLEPQLHGPPQNHHQQGMQSFNQQSQHQPHHHSSEQQSAIATLNAQLSSMGIEVPQSSRGQNQENLLRGEAYLCKRLLTFF